jgi:glycosyltransferase involved in cell wall biosynthesis
MAYYRHFVERQDFELFLATDDKRVLKYNPSYPVLIFEQPAWLERLSRTRFSRWVHSYKHLVAGNFIPAEVMEAAKKFKPDMIFTIAGSWDWTTQMSQRLARELKVPLVGSFNDWFDFSIIVHPWLHNRLEKKFRSFYRACDLAWCTSEGMREELGPHSNAQVVYPIGARAQIVLQADSAAEHPSRFVAVFGGTLSDWYGRMLEQLVRTAWDVGAPIEFRIFGNNQSWTADFERMARERNVFQGHVPFEQLRKEAAQADCLLLLMGFGPECALIERTSFKTKFLDYLAFQKPIAIWGPEYCSAIRYAREFDSAEQCTSPDPKDYIKILLSLKENADRRKKLVENASKMYAARFHPDKIHAHFLEHSLKLLHRA